MVIGAVPPRRRVRSWLGGRAEARSGADETGRAHERSSLRDGRALTAACGRADHLALRRSRRKHGPRAPFTSHLVSSFRSSRAELQTLGSDNDRAAPNQSRAAAGDAPRPRRDRWRVAIRCYPRPATRDSRPARRRDDGTTQAGPTAGQPAFLARRCCPPSAQIEASLTHVNGHKRDVIGSHRSPGRDEAETAA